MKKHLVFAVALFMVAGVGAAEDFDGSKLMICQPLHGHDCLPDAKTCTRLEPEAGKDLGLRIDVANMQVKTPYRNAELPIQTISNNTKSLVLQGTSLEFVWAATIHRTTGRLTVTVADREGSYVIFGQCKLDTKGT